MSMLSFEKIESIETISDLHQIYNKMMKEIFPRVKKINSQIAIDIGMLYIYRSLESEEEKEELIKYWKEISPPKIVQLPMGEYHYRPFVDFINLDNIMNGLFIENVLEQLEKFTTLTFLEACAIIFDLERYYIVPLSEMDVKIIEAVKSIIKESNLINNDILAEKLNVRANYISRRMGYLRNNAYFRVTGTVNFPRIGLYQYLILIESSLEYRDNIPDYFSSPYTRTIRRCPNQRFDYIISLTIPKDFEQKLFSYLRELSDKRIIRCFYCDEVASISNNLDFTYYSYSKRPSVLAGAKPGFYIDWFKERVLTISNDEENTSNGYFQKFIFSGEKTNLTKLDLKILTLYRRDLDTSVRTIAKRLALSWEEANNHIESVREILFPMILLYYTGLNQTALFFFEKITQRNLNKMEFLLARMPQSFIYSFKNCGAIVTVDLMNGANRLNDLICETVPELKSAQFSLASKTGGIFRPLPYNYYDQLTNNWTIPDDFFLNIS